VIKFRQQNVSADLVVYKASLKLISRLNKLQILNSGKLNGRKLNKILTES